MAGRGRRLLNAALVAAMATVLVVVLALKGTDFPWHTKPAEAHRSNPPRAVSTSAVTTPPAAAPAKSTQSPLSNSQLAKHSAAISELARKASERSRELSAYSKFVFGQFNTLGAAHTDSGGNKASRLNGAARTHLLYGILLRHHVDVGALQEFERSQQQVFNHIAGGTYAVWPGLSGDSHDAENSVIWRRSRFELVQAETRGYPYFGGHIRHMPRVLLRDRTTGVEFWVTSYHNPADTGQHPNSAPFRHRAMNMEVADARALVAQHTYPLIISGDMNERQLYFCAMAGGAPMHAANGGSVAGGCRPPSPIWIDWIWGSPSVEFSGYSLDRSSTVQRASDHPIITSTVIVHRVGATE